MRCKRGARTVLGGLDDLVERPAVDDVVVNERGLDEAFGDVKVAGGGVEVVVGRILVGNVGPEVIERAQELLREGSLELLAAGFGGGKGTERVVPGPDDVADATAEFEAPMPSMPNRSVMVS